MRKRVEIGIAVIGLLIVPPIGTFSSYCIGCIALAADTASVLVIEKSGTGSGSVISSTSGISCGSDCWEVYEEGAVVVLAAFSSEDSYFWGWSGECTGVASCTVTMDAAKTVIATFQVNPGLPIDPPASGTIADPIEIVNGKPMDFGSTSVDNWYTFTLGINSNVLVFGSSKYGSPIDEYSIYDETDASVAHYSGWNAITYWNLSAGRYHMNIADTSEGTFSVYSKHIIEPIDENPEKGSRGNPIILKNGVSQSFDNETATNVFYFVMNSPGRLVVSGSSKYGSPIDEYSIYDETNASVVHYSGWDSSTYWDLGAGGYHLIISDTSSGSFTISSPVMSADPFVPLSSPSLSASDGTHSGKVAISWNSVAGASSYKIYRVEEMPYLNVAQELATVLAPTNSYNDSSVTPETTYYYWVKAFNLASESPYSNLAAGSRTSFSWGMFLPAIMMPHECGLGFLGFCEDRASCEKVGGYWYGAECNKTKSYYQEQMEELAGSWLFYYTVNSVTFVESYDFDINTVREYPVGSGKFTITGIDSYGNSVNTYTSYTGLPSPRIEFINYGFPTLDEKFKFYIRSGGKEAKGFFWMTDKGDDFSIYTFYDMWGYRR